MNFFEFFELINLYIKRKKNENYIVFQKFQAGILIKNLKTKLNYNLINSVIDYGCGNGGYSSVLAEFFKKVTAVDYYCDASSFLYSENIEFVQADLTEYSSEPVDFIFCASVLEHIPKDKQFDFIKNIAKNLKNKGYLYLSFPPFYGIQGGHICSPLHYLPDKICFFLTKILKKVNIQSYETMFGGWGLHKTGIAETEKLLVQNGFKILEINSRFMPEWFSKLFGKIDFLNWHVEVIAQKES